MQLPPRESLVRIRSYLRENWESTFYENRDGKGKGMRLPCPFVAPTAGEMFHRLFYWDTYFAVEGVVRDGHVEMARFCAENFMHLTETLGFIPNSASEEMQRSQPPVSTLVYKLSFQQHKDRIWLRRAVNAAITEHAFWMSQRVGPDGLNHYGHHNRPNEIGDFYWVIRRRMPDIPEPLDERLPYLAHKLGEAESGWDFNPRFDSRCMDFYPVDLNALLYAHEMHIAEFLEILGDANAPKWEAKAKARLEQMNALLWDEERGAWFDFDTKHRQRGAVLSAAAIFPLWCGCASEAQASRFVEKALPRLETEFGFDTCEPGDRKGLQYQWDSPNGWPPMHFAAIAGLKRAGFAEEAKRIAAKYIQCVHRGFEVSGKLWEKYNVRSGSIEVVDEYAMPEMLGWTAGTFLYALEQHDLLDDTVPPEVEA